jgi:hypothetical protein
MQMLVKPDIEQIQIKEIMLPAMTSQWVTQAPFRET